MKKTVFLIIFICICLSLGAISVEDLYKSATDTSAQMFSLRTTRYNEFLDAAMGVVRGPSWSIGLNNAGATAVNDFSGVEYSLPSLEVSYSSPETDNKLSFESRLNVGSIGFKSENDFKAEPFSVSLRGGVSKTIDIKSWDATDYSKGLSDKVRTNTYETSVLEFQNGFLDDCIALVKESVKMQDLSVQWSAADNKFRNDVATGVLKEESPDAIKREGEVEVILKDLNLTVESYMKGVSSFKDKYGTDFEIPDSCEDYDLTFNIREEGNTDVLSKYIEYRTAIQKVDEKVGRSSTLTLRSSLEPEVSFAKELKYETTKLKWDLSAGYSTKNLSVDVSLNAGYNFDPTEKGAKKWNDPSITVSGTWSNTPQVIPEYEIERLKKIYGNNTADYQRVLRDLTNKALVREMIEIEQLEYAVTQAQTEWINAGTEYSKKCSELQTQIDAHLKNVELFKIKYDSDKKVLEKKEDLFKQEKATKDECDDALAAVKRDELEEIIFKMQALILHNKIEILNK